MELNLDHLTPGTAARGEPPEGKDTPVPPVGCLRPVQWLNQSSMSWREPCGVVDRGREDEPGAYLHTSHKADLSELRPWVNVSLHLCSGISRIFGPVRSGEKADRSHWLRRTSLAAGG